MIRALALCACLLGVACVRPARSFTCSDSAQCVDGNLVGRCEPDGTCSFPDSSCALGWRAGQYAGDGSRLCVGSVVDLGSDGPGGGYRAAILLDHPKAYYRFEESSGIDAADDSGNGLSGTYFGSYTLGAAGAIKGETSTGVRISPPKAGIIVERTVLDVSGRKPFSVELWVSFASYNATANGTLFALTLVDAKGVQGIALFSFATNSLLSERWVDGNSDITQSMLPSVAQFTHLVLVYDGSTLTLYQNGLFVQQVGDTRAIPSVTSALYIGGGSDVDTAIDGTLDEVALYDYPLSATQVKAHHDLGVSR